MPLVDAFSFASNTQRHFFNECHFTVVRKINFFKFILHTFIKGFIKSNINFFVLDIL